MQSYILNKNQCITKYYSDDRAYCRGDLQSTRQLGMIPTFYLAKDLGLYLGNVAESLSKMPQHIVFCQILFRVFKYIFTTIVFNYLA